MIYDFLLNHKKTIIIIFMVLSILAAVGFMMVNLNSDIVSYLNKNTETIIGKDKLSEEFGVLSEGTLGVSNVTREYIDQTVHKLGEFDNVIKIAYIGTFDSMLDEINNPANPQSVINELSITYLALSRKFYKEDTDTYIITFYLNTVSGDKKSMNMISDAENYLIKTLPSGGEYAFSGTAPNARDLIDSSTGEMPLFVLVAVLGVFILLMIFSKSFMEPFIFLITLGIAVLLNLGSNVILSSVSSITFSASVILQLALSMDYAIFLMHSFYEEKQKALDSKQALRQAMPKALRAVSASAITTVGGFVALFFMRYGMGFDLGIVLAKGVIISLITIMALQPVLILVLDKLINKTQHKSLKLGFNRITDFSIKRYRLIIIVALLLIAPAFIMQFNIKINYLSVKEDNMSNTITQEVIKEDSNQIILLTPYRKGNANRSQFRFYEKAKEVEYVSDIFSITSIVSENSYIGALLTGNELIGILEESFASDNYTLYTFTIDADIESEESYKALNEIKLLAKENFDEYYITGLTQGAYDLSVVTPMDFIIVSGVSVAIILIILLLAFKSLSLAGVLVLIIELGIWINLSITFVLGSSINFMSYIIISAIQLGATVDYAIILASKYEESKKTLPKIDAIKDAIRRAGPSVLTSALVLVVGSISVYVVTSNVIVAEITMLIARGALMSFALVCTLLPAILVYDTKRKERKKLRAEAKSVLKQEIS